MSSLVGALLILEERRGVADFGAASEGRGRSTNLSPACLTGDPLLGVVRTLSLLVSVIAGMSLTTGSGFTETSGTDAGSR